MQRGLIDTYLQKCIVMIFTENIIQMNICITLSFEILCNIYHLILTFCSDDGVLVGYKAVAQSEHNPKNTLYDAKRFIGKRFDREELETLQKQYAFKVILTP